jgi:Large eukaryotic DNA virus major capsid protein
MQLKDLSYDHYDLICDYIETLNNAVCFGKKYFSTLSLKQIVFDREIKKHHNNFEKINQMKSEYNKSSQKTWTEANESYSKLSNAIQNVTSLLARFMISTATKAPWPCADTDIALFSFNPASEPIISCLVGNITWKIICVNTMNITPSDFQTIQILKDPVVLADNLRDVTVELDYQDRAFLHATNLPTITVSVTETETIELNSHNRFNRRAGNYFNYVQPYSPSVHTPADGIGVYSFALHPEQHQPTGTSSVFHVGRGRFI